MGIVLVPVLKMIAHLYAAFPGWLRLGLGSCLGRFLTLLKLRAKVVEQNLLYAFPNSSSSRARLFGEAYRHLGLLVFEIIMLLGPMRRFTLKNSKLVGAENWRLAKARGTGVIFLSSHVGNWEVMAATGAVHGGMDLTIVTKRLKPDWLHHAIESGRARCGVAGAYEPRTLKDVLRQLGKGETVGFVLDQYAGPPVGLRVPVFGIPVGTSSAVATLARRTGASVLPVVNYRTPQGGFVVEIRPALEWIKTEDAEQEIALNTAKYAQEMEKDIYNHPEQWLWIHRRFKGNLSPLLEREWELGRARR